MAEHMNGKAPYARRTFGSDRRGVVPVPAYSLVERRKQSQEDRRRLQDLVRKQSERFEQSPELLELGNKELPAFKHKAELVANIETHKAVIVGGETGSGKSTQLPQFLYEAGYDMTIMLVPRRVIADGLGERIREELGEQIQDFNADESVGITHGERSERHENNRIMVMTPNTFIKMQAELKERFGDKKLAVVADEIHEANLYTEIAVGVAALSVQEHEDWRLIAASATHNAETLEEPFQKLNDGYVPKIEIEGRPFNVELKEEPELTPMEAYARDGFEHEKAMIFTSGKNEIGHIIDKTRSELEARQRGSSNDVVFRILHGELTEVELSHINDPVPEGKRLVIVSSPAGMSGITIPGVTYVATDGTINRSELDDDGASGLQRRVLSRAGITQQIGRAGRDVPGGIGVLCKPVVVRRADRDKEESLEDADEVLGYVPYDKREAHEPPEIYSTNLEKIILSVAALGYDFSKLNKYIPHPVKQVDIVNAEEALARIGALDDDNVVTAIGKRMDQFPVLPELSRGLVEATRPGRTLQHMARAALIAAAIDVGTLQDSKASEGAVKTRNQIIRRTSEDDAMVQLDLMMKLLERTDESWSGYEFVYRHGLHKKRVERARKSAKKILGRMGVSLDNIVLVPPLPDEEQQLRDDFTAGFIDHVYEDIGRVTRSRQSLYRNIHGGETSTERTIDNRSAAKIGSGALVAGMKHWYIKGTHKDGTPIKHDIISSVFPVDPATVAHYAEQNGLIQGKRKTVGMVGDRAVDYVQGVFGSLEVGVPTQAREVEIISPEAQALLVDFVRNRPGKVQRALRDLVKDLEQYRHRIPAETLVKVRKPGASNDLTQEKIDEIIINAATEVNSAHMIEERLRDFSYSANEGLTKYYDLEALESAVALSPLNIQVAERTVALRYEDGQPYVTNMPRRTFAKFKEPIFLEDGREVLYQRSAAGVKERVSFGAI